MADVPNRLGTDLAATVIHVRFTLKADIDRCECHVRRFVPCVDGSELARGIFTLQPWSVQPCVRPVCAVHMTAGHNALRGSGPDQYLHSKTQTATILCK